MFAEMKNIIFKEYPELATAASNIYLIDGGPALLAPKLSRRYLQGIDRARVVVKLNIQVVDYKADTVYLSNGDTIRTKI
jgi:NADH dehydrogenase